MKLLSIAIPCYNSQDYMAHCIESLLPGGEDVEILIVNDGSKDDTAKIADEYAAKYPTIVWFLEAKSFPFWMKKTVLSKSASKKVTAGFPRIMS